MRQKECHKNLNCQLRTAVLRLCSPPDLDCQLAKWIARKLKECREECPKMCKIERKNVRRLARKNPERRSEEMQGRIPEDTSERTSKDMKECQKICQKTVRKNLRRYARQIAEIMFQHTPKKLPAWNVMVGIIRSLVFSWLLHWRCSSAAVGSL